MRVTVIVLKSLSLSLSLSCAAVIGKIELDQTPMQPKLSALHEMIRLYS